MTDYLMGEVIRKVQCMSLYGFYMNFWQVHCPSLLPQVGWLINNRNLLLTFWKLGSVRSRSWKIRYLVRLHFLVHRKWSSFCIPTWWQAGGRSLESLLEDLKPIHEDSNLDLISFPKAPAPHTITLGIKFQPTNLVRQDTNIQSVAHIKQKEIRKQQFF